jgi:Leucine-rich repeat (LRR) protein
LTGLASLYLAHNQIEDIAPLANLTRLMTLDLSDNQIEDVSPLAKLSGLNLVELPRNKVSDLAPLVQAAKADAEGPKRFAPFLRLYLDGNPLSDAAKTEQLAALKSAGVRIMD